MSILKRKKRYYLKQVDLLVAGSGQTLPADFLEYGGMIMTQAALEDNHKAEIIKLPVEYQEDVNSDNRDDETEGKSTEMECLYTTEEILAVYNVFKSRVESASSLAKERSAMRNLTMFVCAINIGLRGGDFCKLTWKRIYDENWNIKRMEKFAPEKQTRRTRTGRIIKRKYAKLRFDSDFKETINSWLQWNIEHGYRPDLDDYVFKTQKRKHIEEKSWYTIVERARIEAGIKQSIGTHGLRKTFGHRYYLSAPNKQEALTQLMIIFAHSDMRVTLKYICISDEEIFENQERMCIFSKSTNEDDFLCSQDENLIDVLEV